MTDAVPDQILYLGHKDVVSLCQELDSVAIIREAFELHGKGQTELPEEAYLGWRSVKDEAMRSLNMPAFLGGPLQIAGTKIINGNIGNPQRGLPRASGLTLLFDPISARVNCILEGAFISSLRTASVSFLAAELFANASLETVGILGAGALAEAHLKLFLKRRSQFPRWKTICLFDLDPTRAQNLSQQLTGDLEQADIQIMITATPEETVRHSSLVIPVTTTTTGYIPFAWLQLGSVLINVSLDDALPEVVFQADQVIVDDWLLVKSDSRRLLGRMYRSGQLVAPDDTQELMPGKQRRVDAQLGEIISGQKGGRKNNDEIILVNPFGLAVEDIALAASLYREALARHTGLWLER